MVWVKKIPFVLLFFIFVNSKTIRSRLYTTENGTKELLFGKSDEVNQKDIDYLLKNLQDLNISTSVVTPVPSKVSGSRSAEELQENILMQHWNSLTEVGWKNFSKTNKKLYLNSSRVLRLAPEFKPVEELGKKEEVKELKTTNIETTKRKPLPDNEKPSTDFCQSIIDLCQITQPQINKKNLVDCLTSKNKTLLSLMNERMKNNEKIDCLEETTENIETSSRAVKSKESMRTLLRPRRLLQKVLLPLLVILIIKYLVTLPFVALSVFTLNAMWLGLLSIGAVIFAKFKGHEYFSQKVPNRRLTHIPGGEVFDVGTPITASEIIWSPVRVPLTQSNIGSHSRLK